MVDKQLKTVIWIGASKKELLEFPQEVIDEVGYILYRVQNNQNHPNIKALKGFNGVFEIVSDYQTDTYRTVYAIKLSNAIFILHAFQKLAREFFDEEEEKHAEKERWMNRKQKPDELVEEYHTIFVANADRAGITDEKEILRQWCRNLLPSIRVAVQTARSSNPALTLQSAVRIAIDVQTSFEEGEPQTAYHHGPEDQGYEEKGVKKVRAIASAAAESVVKSMEAEIAQARRELQKAKEEILSLRQQKEPSQSEMRMARRWEPYRGRGGQTSSSWKRDGYKSQKRQYEDAKQLRRCERCLMFGHQQNECFYDGVCFKCGKQGHKAVACKVRGAPEEQARRSSQQTEDTSVRPKGN